MKTLSPFFLSVVCLVLPVSAEPSQSGGTWFFSVPTKEVEKVRAMAREPKKGTSARLVQDTLGEKPGVRRIFYHWNWPEWLDKPMQRRGYGFGKDGGTRNEGSNVLRYQLKVENGVALQSLALECGDEVNASGTESISFSADCGFLPVYEGQWREMGAWEQGETTWLMWDRFPEAERRDEPAPNGKMWFIEPPPGTSEDADVRREAQFQADAVLACTVELLFFKTTPVAVGQMAKAGPGNREKAAQWLMARDQPWRKLRICQRADGEKRKWSMIHDKRSASKADGVVYKSGLNLQIGGKRTDEVLSMDVVLNHQEGVPTSEWFTATLALEKVTPAWNFALVEKCGELNVVVYRELKPEW